MTGLVTERQNERKLRDFVHMKGEHPFEMSKAFREWKKLQIQQFDKVQEMVL